MYREVFGYKKFESNFTATLEIFNQNLNYEKIFIFSSRQKYYKKGNTATFPTDK